LRQPSPEYKRAGDQGRRINADFGVRFAQQWGSRALRLKPVRHGIPCSKWFGTGFSRLACGADLMPIFQRVGRAETWQDREAAYAKLATMHNELELTDHVTVQIERLWDRLFEVAWAPTPDMLFPLIEDPAVVAIAERWLLGGSSRVLGRLRAKRLILFCRLLVKARHKRTSCGHCRRGWPLVDAVHNLHEHVPVDEVQQGMEQAGHD
jgi:hypothetical protein